MIRFGLLIRVLAIIFLITGGFTYLSGLAEDAPDRPDSQSENPPEENPALEQLAKCADTFYTNENAGVSRIACFVKAPEIFKAQQYRSRYILEKVDYEMIWEPDKPLVVKPRDIPAYFGPEAKVEAGLYAQGIAGQLIEMFKISNSASTVIRQIGDLKKIKSYEIKSSVEGKIQKIELTDRNSEMAGRAKRRRDRSRDKGQKENDDSKKTVALPADITVWLNASNQMNRFEVFGNREKAVGIITPEKYKKQWNIRQLDLTYYKVSWPEKEEAETGLAPLLDFKERVKLEFAYVNPVDKTMIISNIRITRLDKDGKTLTRRNEINPVNVVFSKHEVEKSR